MSLRRARAAAAYYSGSTLGLDIGLVHTRPSGWRFGLALPHQTEQRAGPIPLAGLSMREHVQRVRFQSSNGILHCMGFSPELELGYERMRSNIPLASWGNAFADISLTCRI